MRWRIFWAGVAVATLVVFTGYAILDTQTNVKEYWQKLKEIKIGDEFVVKQETQLSDVPAIVTQGKLSGKMYQSDDSVNCRLAEGTQLGVYSKKFFVFVLVVYQKPGPKNSDFFDKTECLQGVAYVITRWKYLELAEANK